MINQHCIESDNLLDIVGMAIVEHLAACECLKLEDIPELLRKLADEWLGPATHDNTEKGLV